MRQQKYSLLFFVAFSTTAFISAPIVSIDAANGNIDGGNFNSPQKQLVCQSMEIKTFEDLSLLRNCTLIVGHVRLVNIKVPNTKTINDLASSVREITDYLLVYRVIGLRSLSQLFPHLVLIRGRQLLFDEFSLIVYENRNLRDLSFISLQRIQNGAIRIESNPNLCFVHTVHWSDMLGNATMQHFSLTNNLSPNYCPKCIPFSKPDPADSERTLLTHCWNLEALQEAAPGANNCTLSCDAKGCQTKGENCCERACLWGCNTKQKCKWCATLTQDGKCVDSCENGYFEYNRRECITSSECQKFDLALYAGKCVDKCPAPYHVDHASSGQKMCVINCVGDYQVRTLKDLIAIKDCVAIHGSLTIELTVIKIKISDLEAILTNLKEITEYLKIVNSPQLTSLNFFKKLDTIRGDKLIDERYALYVVNNYHLEEIWNINQKVAIINGHIYFHLNPRLCYDKIMALISTMHNIEEIPITDASPNSNGERVICGDAVRLLNATVEAFNSTAARIKVDPMSADDKQVLIGYLHHFKEAPHKNVTMYDGKHGCGHDIWRLDISTSQNIRHIISNLKPYTQYAYFVKTLTMTDYHTQIDAYSRIQYFRTLPSKPGPVARIYYKSLTANQLIVHWWPPRFLTGRIKNYILLYHEVQGNATYKNDVPAKTSMNNCQCETEVDPFNSGPTPEDENYYNKDQITYEEAIPNLIYVQRDNKNDIFANRNRNKMLENTKTNDQQAQLEKQPKTIDTHVHDYEENRIRRATEILNKNVNELGNENNKRSKKLDNDNATPSNISENEFQLFREKMELNALRQQDTGFKDFVIIKPSPICPVKNVTVQYQLENSCKPKEYYDGLVLDGDQHAYILNNLTEEVTYRISLRACVDELENGCGAEHYIFAVTVTKQLHNFLKGIQENSNGET